METLSEQKPYTVKLLIFLQAFLGIGAIFGGLSLIIDTSGKLIHMPLSLLKHSPFDNFLIPAIILFIMLGILPLVVTIGLIKRDNCKAANTLNPFTDKNWSWAFSLYTGFILILDWHSGLSHRPNGCSSCCLSILGITDTGSYNASVCTKTLLEQVSQLKFVNNEKFIHLHHSN